MTKNIKHYIVSIIILTGLFGQSLNIGDTCPDVTLPICINGTGNFELYEEALGELNGGDYKVVWFPIFASW
tara:strand:+ start:497 stop:709 length:213 start_codon:yes stop_codon:yes gene_type:complete